MSRLCANDRCGAPIPTSRRSDATCCSRKCTEAVIGRRNRTRKNELRRAAYFKHALKNQQRGRTWRARNLKRVRALDRARYAGVRRDEMLLRAKKWSDQNKDKRRIITRAYRWRKIEAEGKQIMLDILGNS